MLFGRAAWSQRWLPLVLLLALSRPAAAGGSSSSGLWYTDEYENDFFESLLLIVFVFLALAFEILWHGLGHEAEHSYRYGKYHYLAVNELGMPAKDHRGNMQHPQLYKELYNRMGGEFMTLGILAFLIFVCNQSGGFVKLAKSLKPCVTGCFHHPNSDGDWLHLAEMVHVKLFVGMLLYYVLIFCLVRGSVRQIQQWEKLRMRFTRAENETFPVPTRSLDRDLEKHTLWRDYFVEHVFSWRRTRPDMFKTIMEKLDLDPVAPDAEQRLRQTFDERFSLSAYLALNLENSVIDAIEVHKPTWALLLAFFGFFALLHHEAHLSLKTFVPIFIGLAFLVFLVIWYFKREAQRQIKRFVQRCRSMNEKDGFDPAQFFRAAEKARSASKVQGRVRTIHERYATEVLVLRAMQVFLFLISYVFSQTLIAVDAWKTNPEIQLLNSLLFLSLFMVIARFLPSMVPIFVAVMAFPPYVDASNLAAFFAVLLDDHAPDAKECISPGVSSVQLVPKSWRLGASSTSACSLESIAEDGRPAAATAAAAACAGTGAGAGTSLAAVRELAELLGVGEQLEKRLQERGGAVGSGQPAVVAGEPVAAVAAAETVADGVNEDSPALERSIAKGNEDRIVMEV